LPAGFENLFVNTGVSSTTRAEKQELVYNDEHKSQGGTMSRVARNIIDLKAWIGVLIIIFAVVLLLRNLELIPYINLWAFWPLFLLVIGLSQLLRPAEYRQTLSGSIFVVVGMLFMLNNMEIIDFGFRELWPFILLVVGFAILRQSMIGSKSGESENEFINLTFILGGGDHKFYSKTLRGGRVSAIMGGGKIDLRDADLAEDEVIFDIFAFWGGFELIVPQGWQVNMKAVPILGGVENRTQPDPNASSQVKRLTVRGTAIMGGMEVKN
jgi:predicted membrane protein